MVNFFEKIFCRNGKRLYFCTRFRREGMRLKKGESDPGRRGREEIETDEKEEIACVGRILGYAGDTKTSQEGKKAILTMKSLILAQDER